MPRPTEEDIIQTLIKLREHQNGTEITNIKITTREEVQEAKDKDAV